MNIQKLWIASLLVLTLAACKKDKPAEDTGTSNKTCTLSSFTSQLLGNMETFQIEYAPDGNISKLKSDLNLHYNRKGDSLIISLMGVYRLGYIVYDHANRPKEYFVGDVDEPETFSRILYQYTGSALVPSQITVNGLIDSNANDYIIKNMIYLGENLVSCDLVFTEDEIEEVFALNYEYNLSKKNTAINLYKQLIPLDFNTIGPLDLPRYVSKNAATKLNIPSQGMTGTYTYSWDQWGNMLSQAIIMDGDTMDTESYTYLCK